jgi:hypothetical protein
MPSPYWTRTSTLLPNGSVLSSAATVQRQLNAEMTGSLGLPATTKPSSCRTPIC